MLKTPRSLAPRGFQSDLHFRTKRRFGGRDGNRTRTPYNWRRILSPLRLPIPSPGQCQTFEKRSVKTDLFMNSGAGNEARTRDINLGKVALYQLSYSRVRKSILRIFLSFAILSQKYLTPPIPSAPTSRLPGNAWSFPIVRAS